MSFDEVSSLAARRGFFWNAYEIYGGVRGFITWGPLGTILKRKIADLWRRIFIEKHGFYEIDSPSIAPQVVFKASGHVDHFKDIMISCLKCGRKFKADQLLEEAGYSEAEALDLNGVVELVKSMNVSCPECGGELGDPRYFTTMFKTTIGPYAGNEGFFRPETAQGIFTEFKRLYILSRGSLPLGIAQVGRGFRNEISPRQGPIRLREFDMMELELFYDPKNPQCPYLSEVSDVELNLLHSKLLVKGVTMPEKMSVLEAVKKKLIFCEWLAYFMALSQIFLEKLGIPAEKQRFREKLPGERAHYSRQTFDQEVYLSNWGWVEVSGHADRSDYDLAAHSRMSGEDLRVKRRLDKPATIRKEIIKPKIDKIREFFKDKSEEVLKKLSEKSDLMSEFKMKGYVEVSGFKIGEEFLEVVVKEEKKYFEEFTPYVAEPSFGLDRVAYSVLEYGFKEREGRVILSIPPYIAPIEAAVFPIVAKSKFIDKSRELYRVLREEFRVIHEVKDSIGKRYARADEIGVPVAYTIDGETLKNNTVTARDRDTWLQVRVRFDDCLDFLRKLIKTGSFSEASKEFSIGAHP